MKPRDAFLLTALAVLSGGLAWIALGAADASPVVGATLSPAEPRDSDPEPPEPAGAQTQVALMTDDATPERRQSETEGMTKGVIMGHITVAADAYSKIDSLYVHVQEAINGKPGYVHDEKIPLNPEGGLPDFSIGDIPFSEFGYTVTAYAPKLNGSEQFVQVTRDCPIAEAVLGITNGVSFTVLVKNQLKAPLGDQRVYMVPVGKPLGRPTLQKTTNNFGAAIFTDVLQGHYDIRIGDAARPRNDPTEVTIHAAAGIASTTVILQDGQPLEVRVQRRGGWGLEGAKVEIVQTDTVQYRHYGGKTDYAGLYRVKLTPGEYQVNVLADGFQPFTRSVRVAADQAPAPLDANLSLQ